ncbi:MAG: EpsD family peptidyl-prolyl cis-trans isomerase [Burkholderiales bacterium]
MTLALLNACGKTQQQGSAQAAATVNGKEVSASQIDFALARAGTLSEEQRKQASKRVLEQLINQQLLLQKAAENKLESDPKVQQTIEAAAKQILAQAYLEKIAAGAPKPTPEAIAEFYTKHPELFSERRIYRFNQLVIGVSQEQHGALKSKLEELDKKSQKTLVMRDLVAWLQSQGLKFRAGSATQAAEQLPLEMLPTFHKMKEGDLMLLPAQGGVQVLQLVASQTQALDQEKAKPVLEKYLLNRARLTLSQDELKRLRDSAKIEYLGEFKQAAADGKAGAQAGLPEAAHPAGQEPATLDGNAPNTGEMSEPGKPAAKE